MARRSSSSTDYEAFEVGDQVRHPKWGVGSILFKSGTGEASKAIVVFPEQGQKKLLLKFAGLERVNETVEADEDEFGLAEEPKAPAAAPAAKRGAGADDEEEAEVLPAEGFGKDEEWDAEEEEEEEEEKPEAAEEEEF